MLATYALALLRSLSFFSHAQEEAEAIARELDQRVAEAKAAAEAEAGAAVLLNSADLHNLMTGNWRVNNEACRHYVFTPSGVL